MVASTSNIYQELRRRHSPTPFVPFAVITSDGKEHRVRRSAQFALREEDMMLAASDGTEKIRFVDIARIEERPIMTPEQERTRELLAHYLNESPFGPFAINFNDGARFEIVRRLQAGIGLTKGLVVSPDRKARRNFHLSEIKSIEALVPA